MPKWQNSQLEFRVFHLWENGAWATVNDFSLTWQVIFLLSHIILLFEVNSSSNLSDKEKTPSPCCDLLRPGHREVRSTATPSTSAQPYVIQMSVPFYVDGLAQDVGAVIIRIGRPLWEHRKRERSVAKDRYQASKAQDACGVGYSAQLGSASWEILFYSFPVRPLVFLSTLVATDNTSESLELLFW